MKVLAQALVLVSLVFLVESRKIHFQSASLDGKIREKRQAQSNANDTATEAILKNEEQTVSEPTPSETVVKSPTEITANSLSEPAPSQAEPNTEAPTDATTESAVNILADPPVEQNANPDAAAAEAVDPETTANVPSLRLKRETTSSVLPSWLENIVRDSGKRSKDQVLMFIKNIGIQFIRKKKDGDNSKTEVPSIRNDSNTPKESVNNSLTQFNSLHSTQNTDIESDTTVLNTGNNEITLVANKTKKTAKNQKLIVQNQNDFLTAQRENISKSATKGKQLIDSNADDGKISKPMVVASTPKTKDNGVGKTNAKVIKKEKTMETLQTSTSVIVEEIQNLQTVIVTTPKIFISTPDRLPQKNFGRKIKSIFTR
uniref:Uncharacterized protein n=1 Tax=Magallana gigas TaxID=29159 RepID=K1RC74_MAGGI